MFVFTLQEISQVNRNACFPADSSKPDEIAHTTLAVMNIASLKKKKNWNFDTLNAPGMQG